MFLPHRLKKMVYGDFLLKYIFVTPPSLLFLNNRIKNIAITITFAADGLLP